VARDDDPVELGVQLLARLEHAELPLPEVIDRIETISTHPETTRAILEEAERRGHISRDGDTVRRSPAGFSASRARSSPGTGSSSAVAVGRRSRRAIS